MDACLLWATVAPGHFMTHQKAEGGRQDIWSKVIAANREKIQLCLSRGGNWRKQEVGFVAWGELRRNGAGKSPTDAVGTVIKILRNGFIYMQKARARERELSFSEAAPAGCKCSSNYTMSVLSSCPLLFPAISTFQTTCSLSFVCSLRSSFYIYIYSSWEVTSNERSLSPLCRVRHGQNANLFLVLQQRLRLLYGLFLNLAL